MAISFILKINNTLVPKIKGYKLQRNKLWTDAGRNMAGELKSVFIGIFPKILLEIGYTTKDEMSQLIGLLDNPSFDVAYYDSKTQTVKTGLYYAGDFDIPLFRKSDEVYQSFNVNLIPFNKE